MASKPKSAATTSAAALATSKAESKSNVQSVPSTRKSISSAIPTAGSGSGSGSGGVTISVRNMNANNASTPTSNDTASDKPSKIPIRRKSMSASAVGSENEPPKSNAAIPAPVSVPAVITPALPVAVTVSAAAAANAVTAPAKVGTNTNKRRSVVPVVPAASGAAASGTITSAGEDAGAASSSAGGATKSYRDLRRAEVQLTEANARLTSQLRDASVRHTHELMTLNRSLAGVRTELSAKTAEASNAHLKIHDLQQQMAALEKQTADETVALRERHAIELRESKARADQYIGLIEKMERALTSCGVDLVTFQSRVVPTVERARLNDFQSDIQNRVTNWMTGMDGRTAELQSALAAVTALNASTADSKHAIDSSPVAPATGTVVTNGPVSVTATVDATIVACAAAAIATPTTTSAPATN